MAEGEDAADQQRRHPGQPYGHGSGATVACAITGGAFYNPATGQFPASYVGTYFFADYCSGWIRRMDPSAGNAVSAFASGIAAPVDLKVGDVHRAAHLPRGGWCHADDRRKLAAGRGDDVVGIRVLV